MRLLNSQILTLCLILIANFSFAQCPGTVSSLGVGNGLQFCWPNNEGPTEIDTIYFDGVAYTVHEVNAGQGDCWRTDQAATTGVNGNQQIEVIIDGITTGLCTVVDGTVGDNQLPIELGSFNATEANDHVLIEWQTFTEENNAYFEVQRSTDGVIFETIAEIQGAGTTDAIQFYELEDVEAVLQKGTYYYRLRQVDFNGEFTTFNMVAVTIKNAQEFELSRIFPNPAQEQLNLLVEFKQTPNAELLIVDATGRQLLQQQVNSSIGSMEHVSVDISELQAGCYFVRIQAGNTAQTQKFVKL